MEKMITLRQPPKLVFGNGCSQQLAEDLSGLGRSRVLIVTSNPVMPIVSPLSEQLKSKGITVTAWDAGDSEPTIAMLDAGVETFRSMQADAVVGLGGGSVLDLAKLIAALHDSR